MNKKKGLTFILRGLALLFGIVGLVCFILSNTISPANALANFPLLTCLSVLALLATALSLLFLGKGEQGELVVAAISILAVALYTITIGRHINGRVLLMSGLFTWNSMNMEGWRVFYMVVASSVGYLLSVLSLIVASFVRDQGN